MSARRLLELLRAQAKALSVLRLLRAQEETFRRTPRPPKESRKRDP